MNAAGKLNIEQYALAMHFVHKKLTTGLDPPIELTPEMVPPSMRPKMPLDVSIIFFHRFRKIFILKFQKN